MRLRERVVVAMSGGVDSSTAAYLLKKSGHDVIGITMKLWEENGRCCSLADIRDIQRVAHRLSIPIYTLDLTEYFKKEVIEYFCQEYLNARTPNPCIVCNEKIKFGILLKKAKEFDALFIATGHYAGVFFDPFIKRYCLKKGKDPKKEQSYFLFSLSQEKLSRAIFPLADFTKRQVRQIAAEVKLPVQDKKESQEICFVSQKNYNEFLRKKIPECLKPGPIVDKEGKTVGWHEGIFLFTIGQRRGLPGGRKKPAYVIEIRKEENTVVVGEKEDVYSISMEVGKVNWVSIPAPKKPFNAMVKIRYQQPESPARIYPLGEEKVRVDFFKPQWAITPGQAAVFYREDILLGGGWIEKPVK